MNCAIDHAIPGTVPGFLCRKCHPELKEPWTPRGSHQAATVIRDDFRSRYPLTDEDEATIAVLEAEEKATAKAKALNRIASLKAKIAERQAVSKADNPQPVKEVKEPEIELDDKPVVLHRKPGIISCVLEMMRRKGGATHAEIHAELVKRYPDRDPKGMLSTCKIQSRKLCTSVVEDGKRGLVFYAVEAE